MTTMTELDIAIRMLPEVRMAALPHAGAYSKAGPVFARLSALVTERGLEEKVLGSAMIGYHNPAITREEDLRAHVCAIVSEDFRMFPPFEEVRYPAGRYAVMIHEGSYAGLARAYRRLLGEWLPSSGEQLAGRAPYEVYMNRPDAVAPEDLRTEIRIPLAG